MNSLDVAISDLEKERDSMTQAIDLLKGLSSLVGGARTNGTAKAVGKNGGRKWTAAQRLAQSRRLKAYHAKQK